MRRNLIRFLLTLSLGLSTTMTLAYEEPAYTVQEKTEDYELRRYESYLVAETRVDGSFKSAGNDAFRILAGYIFGDNVPAKKMAMTAPVVSRKTEQGEKMAMTAPVISASANDDGGDFVYQFVMESKYTMDTLPMPIDDRVTIRRVPERLVAARRFSGTWSEKRVNEQTSNLMQALGTDGILVAGQPELARYNGPLTPWFMRRNEILVDVETTP